MEKVENLIIKYLTESITHKEWNELNEWINNSHEGKLFSEYARINYAIDDIMSEFNTERTKRTLLEKIQKDKRFKAKKNRTRLIKYAAVFTVLLGLGILYQQRQSSENSNKPVSQSVNEITLELQDGSLKVLEKNQPYEVFDSEGNVVGVYKNNRLVYTNSHAINNEPEENLLTVPYGKRLEVEFSDGTVAFLNAGTSIKYPVNFDNSETRNVVLTGEAFFEVVRDSVKPFLVSTSNNFDVKVLGTKFNISNYSEDNTTEVVLVEGSVGLYSHKTETDVILEPGLKGSFDRLKGDISTKPVITNVYTSWINGELIFRNMTFDNLLKKLERHYNVTIINHNSEFSDKRLNANFGDEPIEVVLKYFKNTYGIEYTINQSTIILN
ncbi:hypothetical protein MTsPCn9_25650 [Croceitalea sp. MTPC9]|uniref:FecR family protein n=1 Tax=unclassified Croceitalea TaxID=2632280 RepID=UPI002B3966E2|nr:hypothetical protein MTsPCn6_28880 [Croceitalea sp. MTPC6]GMN17627.1 hypothetical protein MTsPCn9_25650 [Croceitalea sp. MTPC9]